MATTARKIAILIILTLLLVPGAFHLFAQSDDAQPISIGETLTVNIPPTEGEGENLTAPAGVFTFTLEEPQYITLIARPATADGTTPLLGLYEDTRELIRINNTSFAINALGPNDAIIEDQLLLAGTYNITLQRMNAEGNGDIILSLEEGNAPFLGIGEMQIIDAEIGAGDNFILDVDLTEGDLVSIAAITQDSEAFDLRINVRDPQNEIIARNDDHETLEVFLGDFDPKIDQLTIPQDGTYQFLVRGFSGEDFGPFRVIFTQYGQLDTSIAGVETITDESLPNARNTFTPEFQAGEIVTITARAIDNSSLDPEIRLLDPDNIFVAINDDHGTNAEDLGQFDARVENILLTKGGTYTLDINSVSGFGAYEIVIERFGVFQNTDIEPVDLSNFRVENPNVEAPAPEATEEP